MKECCCNCCSYVDNNSIKHHICLGEGDLGGKCWRYTHYPPKSVYYEQDLKEKTKV